MYGSQFQAEQALTLIRPSTQELANHTYCKSGNRVDLSRVMVFFVFTALVFSISNLSFAGPSQPRIKGGNGNSNGR